MKTVEERMNLFHEGISCLSFNFPAIMAEASKQLTEQAAEWQIALNEALAESNSVGALGRASELLNSYREELAKERGEAATLADDLRKEWKKAQDEAKVLRKELTEKACNAIGCLYKDNAQLEANAREFMAGKLAPEAVPGLKPPGGRAFWVVSEDEYTTLADLARHLKEWNKGLEEDLKAAKLLGVKSVQTEAGNWEFFKEQSLATIANLEARLAEDEAEHAAQLEHVETELMKSHNRDTDDLRGRYQHLIRKLIDLLLDAS